MTPERRPSPNFGPRRGEARPDIVVLHFTAMPDVDEALTRLCDPEAKVSAHYLIARNGAIWRLVDEGERAWHAGSGVWGAVDEVNSRSIGIELDNAGNHPYSEPLMASLETLLPEILARWSIPRERVIGHSDLAPDRKRDPGPRFDWRRLALKGLAVWPEGTAAAEVAGMARFRDLARRFGYHRDFADDQVLRAFRDRFRAGDDGPLDVADLAMISELAARFPVDLKTPSA